MKVHFAGMQTEDLAYIACELCGVKNNLWSCFDYISKEAGLTKSNGMFGLVPPVFLQDVGRKSIMDSGLYTLMFGAHAGERSEAFMWKWQGLMIDFVQKSGFTGTIVECDVQKILGVETAWKFRKALRDALPNEQIAAFHIEDGQKGWERMIEWSPYVAISVPELRKRKIPNLPEYIMKMASYAKNKKPDIKIHLLGCTADKIMTKTRFCDTCDSTSWLALNRYGSTQISTSLGTKIIKNTSLEGSKIVEDRVIEVLSRYREKPLTSGLLARYVSFAIICSYLLNHYKKVAGDQT